MQNNPQNIYVYCVACDAGSEDSLKSDLEQRFPQAIVLFPLYDRKELKNGVWTVRSRPLMPGYVFIYSSIAIEAQAFYSCHRVKRLLGYAEEGYIEHTLAGKDLDFAQWVLFHNGHIGISRAMLVGDKTQIIDGPLKTYEGEILKIDRRRHSALMAVNMGEVRKNVWLSFHWMTLQNGVLVDWIRQ